MFAGRIQGVGPRYCPSIEDKIERFSHRSRHQLFVEPEGWDTVEYYINGFSSSLPDDVQVAALRNGCSVRWRSPLAPDCVITSYSIHYTKLYEMDL